jgi:hypothetical protein
MPIERRKREMERLKREEMDGNRQKWESKK